MNPVRARRQRGVALLALLAVIALGASWFVVSRLNNNSNAIVAANRNRNAAVLNQAKRTLIGYIAQQAAENTEDNPGRLPCPEAPGNFNSAANEGTAAGNCSLPAVGRFPWRTLGMDKLVDTAGEPLWYVVSPGWALPSAGATLVINSNTAGQLQVDGAANDSVALIIAPGPAFSVPAATGCTAWNQTRPTTGTPDWRNYLECENATNPADSVFVTTGPSASFNDQVVRITVADVLPAIEAAIAHRIERDVAPVIRSMYSNAYPSPYQNTLWPAALALPFAAPFANPSTSSTQGSAGTYQGLLPLTYSETVPKSGIACTPGASVPRCNPTFVAWKTSSPSPTITQTGGGTFVSAPCTASTSTQISCTITMYTSIFSGSSSMNFNLTADAQNVGMALRVFNTSAAMTGFAGTPSPSGVINADGSATVTLSGTISGGGGASIISSLLCGLSGILAIFNTCYKQTITVPITLLADHPILDPTTTGAGNLGWFLRNKWNEVTYYAVAAGIAPSATHTCITNSTCLYATYHPNNGKLRGLIVLSGRGLTATSPPQSRPSGTLTDYLEGGNATATGSAAQPFQIRSPTLLMNRTFEDRIAVIDSN